MKRLFIIALVACFVVSIAMPILAKVKFGNWDKWDEQLPPADNERWYWAFHPNLARVWTFAGWGKEGKDLELLSSEIFFYGRKDGKTKASVIFYSSANVVIEDWDIPNARLALVAFPPKKKEMIIRAYKMENQIFKFFEEWRIPFKDGEVVVTKDRKFYQEFKMWLKGKMKEDINDEVLNERFPYILPILIIRDKTFIIYDTFSSKYLPPKWQKGQ
jgi:hypothetical protein